MGCVSSRSKKNKAKGSASVPAGFTQSAAHRRANIKMVQNMLLIWLDANINDNNADSQNTITQLRQVINTIEAFDDGENCIQFLEEIRDEKACMIISGSLGRHIVPRVHDMSQVDSIFIFCSNKRYHERWVTNWSKVKGVFTDINLICDALKQSAKDCEHNAIRFTMMDTGKDISRRNLDQLDPMFMYTHIMKEILLEIEFEDKHILNFTKYCQQTLEQDNKKELDNVKLLERDYHIKTPIWWYTLDSFLYGMLNRALARSEVDVIIKMGFFIGDIHRHITELHKNQFAGENANEKFIVYRGQGMSKEDLENVSKNKGGLISFNNFLSTSKTEKVAMDFLKRALSIHDRVGVLFVITIGPAQSTTPFASVAEVGYFKNEEDEILFAMHTVFRIKRIGQADKNPRIFRVELELTNDNDKDLQALTGTIREETYPDEAGWQRLAEVLVMKLGQPVKAEEIYQILMKQESRDNKKGYLYNRLGLCKLKQAEYTEAIQFYEKSIETYEMYSQEDHLGIAWSYSNLGLVYSNMSEYENAHSYYEKALVIRQQSLPFNHPDLASSYNNIGNVCYNMSEYEKAHSYYEKALTIRQGSLPSKHPDLATSHNNIGLV
ncbi:unnamed protein product [Rotaria socialis]|uniref:Uncharacterized protein n=1 Tax=Rotaria socialis TaxID=392032 RepID=A0A821UXD3_9BILA|nr:unnamed protein product [Rotaria socialis]CAF4897174.1 unnamed protein product [Rotaria socialis]